MTSAEFVDCRNLPPGSLLEVETRNRHYQIECLGGSAIRISGHPQYCPTPVDARLHGFSDKDGPLDPGIIGRGRHLQFLVGERCPVTTTRVVRVRVQRPEAAPPQHSTIH